MKLSNMPWEDRPKGSKEVLWRYSNNPIIHFVVSPLHRFPITADARHEAI